MARTTLFAGIALMIVSFVFLMTMLVTAPAPDSTGFLTALLCSNDEIMTRTTGERFEPGFFKVNKVPTHLFCQHRGGEMREVTGQAFTLVMGSYLVVFLTGIFTFLFACVRLMRARVQKVKRESESTI